MRFPVALTYHVFEKIRAIDMTLAEFERLLGRGEVIEEHRRTDTQVEANFAVHTALSVIRAYGPDRLDRVLIVWPGLDFAPRTDLLEAYEPQSYQPWVPELRQILESWLAMLM